MVARSINPSEGWRMRQAAIVTEVTGQRRRRVREAALDALAEVGRPMSVRLLREWVAAAEGWALPEARFARLVRDEASAFGKEPGHRSEWVVPALAVGGLTATAVLTRSDWEPERRLIGSRTLRVNHLRTLLFLLDAGSGEDS